MRAAVALVSVLGAACSRAESPDDDADAAITLPDVLFFPDAGSDAAGVCGDTTDSFLGFPALPRSCLPLCTAQTAAAIRECTTPECVSATVAADMSPPVSVSTYFGIYQVSFSGAGSPYRCLTWQQYSCWAEWCTDPYNIWARCTAADCSAELAAVHACADASTDYQRCAETRLPSCYLQ